MVITCGRYRIRPYTGLHCWTLERRVDRDDGVESWSDCMCYKPTLEGAAAEMWERAAKEEPGEYDVARGDALVAALAGLRDSLVSGVAGKAAAR